MVLGRPRGPRRMDVWSLVVAPVLYGGALEIPGVAPGSLGDVCVVFYYTVCWDITNPASPPRPGTSLHIPPGFPPWVIADRGGVGGTK